MTVTSLQCQIHAIQQMALCKSQHICINVANIVLSFLVVYK